MLSMQRPRAGAGPERPSLTSTSMQKAIPAGTDPKNPWHINHCKPVNSGKDSHALQQGMQLCSNAQRQKPNSAVLLHFQSPKANITAILGPQETSEALCFPSHAGRNSHSPPAHKRGTHKSQEEGDTKS